MKKRKQIPFSEFGYYEDKTAWNRAVSDSGNKVNAVMSILLWDNLRTLYITDVSRMYSIIRLGLKEKLTRLDR